MERRPLLRRSRGLALAAAGLERRRDRRQRALARTARTALHDRRLSCRGRQLGCRGCRRFGTHDRFGVRPRAIGIAAVRTQRDAAVDELEIDLVSGREAELRSHTGGHGEPAVVVESYCRHGCPTCVRVEGNKSYKRSTFDARTTVGCVLGAVRTRWPRVEAAPYPEMGLGICKATARCA